MFVKFSLVYAVGYTRIFILLFISFYYNFVSASLAIGITEYREVYMVVYILYLFNSFLSKQFIKNERKQNRLCVMFVLISCIYVEVSSYFAIVSLLLHYKRQVIFSMLRIQCHRIQHASFI